MGCCSCKLFGYFIVFIAVFIKVGNPILDALIVPKEAKPEKQEKESLPPSFVPNQTDILGYEGFHFLNASVEETEVYIGFGYMLQQSFPKWFMTLWYKFVMMAYSNSTVYSDYENHTVDILDARKRQSELSFKNNGFTLLKLKEPTKTQNFRDQQDVQKFQAEIMPQLMELFPGASRINFTYSVIRGGHMFGDQPAAVNGPHLDYSQNATRRREFHQVFEALEYAKEPRMLLGMHDTKEEEVRAMIGIWKPVYMNNPVCDHPLAIMDASTFTKEQERPQELHMNFLFFIFHNLAANFIYSPSQKWYYYSFQEEDEVLIFTQYTKDKFWATPHGSFKNPNCPEDYETRVSIEARAGVFYPRDAPLSLKDSP